MQSHHDLTLQTFSAQSTVIIPICLGGLQDPYTDEELTDLLAGLSQRDASYKVVLFPADEWSVEAQIEEWYTQHSGTCQRYGAYITPSSLWRSSYVDTWQQQRANLEAIFSSDNADQLALRNALSTALQSDVASALAYASKRSVERTPEAAAAHILEEMADVMCWWQMGMVVIYRHQMALPDLILRHHAQVFDLSPRGADEPFFMPAPPRSELAQRNAYALRRFLDGASAVIVMLVTDGDYVNAFRLGEVCSKLKLQALPPQPEAAPDAAAGREMLAKGDALHDAQVNKKKNRSRSVSSLAFESPLSLPVCKFRAPLSASLVGRNSMFSPISKVAPRLLEELEDQRSASAVPMAMKKLSITA